MSRVDEETEGQSLPAPEDDFQAVWNRMMARTADVRAEDVVMAGAREAQRAVRKSNA